jgi:hypothetical protein
MPEETPQPDGRIPWHSGFRAALVATLEPYRDILELKFEHHLTAEALRLDALIIKKKRDAPLKHDIAAFFKTWNVLEYKSPEDTFSVVDFHKVLGYAHIYMATEPGTVWEEGTVTIIRTGESRSVLKHLKDHGCLIEQRRNDAGEVWAYEVKGYGIPIQIIQSEHLSESGNLLLRHLRRNIDTGTLKKVLEESEVYRRIGFLEAYLQVLLEANKAQFKEITAMMNSPIIEQVLEESGWADKIRKQERQAWNKEITAMINSPIIEQVLEESGWADKIRKQERQAWNQERQKVEAENAELKEQLRLFQHAQAKPSRGSGPL